MYIAIEGSVLSNKIRDFRGMRGKHTVWFYACYTLCMHMRWLLGVVQHLCGGLVWS